MEGGGGGLFGEGAVEVVGQSVPGELGGDLILAACGEGGGPVEGVPKTVDVALAEGDLAAADEVGD